MSRSAFAVMFVFVLAGCGPDTPSTPPAVTGISYVGVSVSSLDDAITFYRDPAGLSVIDDSPWSESAALDALAGRRVSMDTTLLRSSNAQLRFMQFRDRPEASVALSAVPVNGPGIAHVCFQVDDKTQTYQQFVAKGATPVGAPKLVQLSDRRPVSYAYSRDADGIMIEIEHVDVSKLELPTPPKHDRRLRHVSIATPDMDRATRFYSMLLGIEKPRRVGRWFGGVSGEKVDQVAGLEDVTLAMTWYQVGNLELELIEYKSHPPSSSSAERPIDARGYNMIVFDVTDLTVAEQQLVAAGGRVVSAPEPHGDGTIFFGRDPDGNLLGFLRVAADSVFSAENFESQRY